jgi:hypothetical protein
MAKINLLTLHYASNNGSFLQSYCTCEILKECGHDVTVINLQAKSTVLGKYKSLRTYLYLPRYFIFWLYRKLKFSAKETRLMFDINKQYIPKADYTIVGSDQVWNMDLIKRKKMPYFLDFVDDNSKKISLSSSFGKKEWECSADLTQKVTLLLKQFEAISVREESGIDICRDIFAVKATCVVDPTLAYGDFSKLIKFKELINIIVPIIIFGLYLYGLIWIYLSVGLHDWNFTNALPLANVSPFMFTFTFLNLFLPKIIKKYVYTLISLLSVGMLIAGLLVCVSYIAREYTFHLGIVTDAFAHVLLALYGIYLVKTEQTFINKKNIIISGLIIICVALIMLILNLIFDKSFFGLSLYGKHNIYGMILTKNSYFSVIIYFIGLTIVLLCGYLFPKLIIKTE